jgi:hypothetical protein
VEKADWTKSPRLAAPEDLEPWVAKALAHGASLPAKVAKAKEAKAKPKAKAN